MRTKLATISLLVAAVAGGTSWVVLRPDGSDRVDAQRVRRWADERLGISFSIPVEYSPARSTDTPARRDRHFERNAPQQAFLTVSFETGLSGPATLLKRNLIEHLEAEIRQFFPVKYSKYESLSLRRAQVAGRQSVEHSFRYVDGDGKPLGAMMVAIPWDHDSAYYVILQAHATLFARARGDFRAIVRTVVMRGPQPTQSTKG